MEINIGSSFGGNIGVNPETQDVGFEGARRGITDASKVSRPTSSLTIGEGVVGLSSAEPTADIPDSALRRDDDLGKLVNSVFNMMPPQMPNFVV